MPIWTQRASFSWRQNIGFFEHRYAILRQLEDQGLLRRFQERPSSVAVRIQGPHQLIIFGDDGLFIGTFKPDAVMDVMRAAVEVICEALEPEPTGYPIFKFQWLNACEGSYDEARQTAAKAFLGDDHPAQVADFALLLDAKLETPFDDCHLEFGIVDATEAPRRLSRGMHGLQNERDSPPGLWPPGELPQVAIFCDVRLDAASPLGASDIVANMFATIEAARDVADQLMASMLRPLDGPMQ
jgi:hypothetical protein